MTMKVPFFFEQGRSFNTYKFGLLPSTSKICILPVCIFGGSSFVQGRVFGF